MLISESIKVDFNQVCTAIAFKWSGFSSLKALEFLSSMLQFLNDHFLLPSPLQISLLSSFMNMCISTRVHDTCSCRSNPSQHFHNFWLISLNCKPNCKLKIWAGLTACFGLKYADCKYQVSTKSDHCRHGKHHHDLERHWQ